MLRGVVNVEMADDALVIDEAAKHERGVLLVDLLAALEDEVLVDGLESEQHVREDAQQLRALGRRLAVLLHLEEHDLDGLDVERSANANAFELLLALEEVEQREREDQPRLLGHRGLDGLHQPLLDQRHVAVVRAQQERFQLVRRLQRDQREHQRRVHARERFVGGGHGLADVPEIPHERLVGVSSRRDGHERNRDGARGGGGRGELEVLVEKENVLDGAAAVLEVLDGLVEAALGEEEKRGIEVELVDDVAVEIVVDGDGERLVVERRVLLREELDLVFGSEQTELVDVVRGVEEERRGGEVVVGDDSEAALQRNALDAPQIDEIVHVEVVAHQHEAVRKQSEELRGLRGDAEKRVFLAGRKTAGNYREKRHALLVEDADGVVAVEEEDLGMRGERDGEHAGFGFHAFGENGFGDGACLHILDVVRDAAADEEGGVQPAHAARRFYRNSASGRKENLLRECSW